MAATGHVLVGERRLEAGCGVPAFGRAVPRPELDAQIPRFSRDVGHEVVVGVSRTSMQEADARHRRLAAGRSPLARSDDAKVRGPDGREPGEGRGIVGDEGHACRRPFFATGADRLALSPKAAELTPHLRVARGLVRQPRCALGQPRHEHDVPARVGEVREPSQRLAAA